MTHYQKTLQAHLGRYKSARLGIDRPGTYTHKGRTLSYAHILPRELLWLNVLEPYRAEIREHLHPDQLHKYFHHLNSSQAFALNLFFPFLAGGPEARGALERALCVGVDVARFVFEHVPDVEEGTTVDVSWVSQDGFWTFCEVKLSEQEFGQAKGEPRHYRKLLELYEPLLRDHCTPEMLKAPRFFKHYQVLRNLWVCARAPGSRLLFLLPRANEALWGPLHEVLDCVRSPFKERVVVAAVEDVLYRLMGDASLPPNLATYVGALREKYLPAP